MIVDIIGFALFGFLIGLITGLSETSGTAKKALGVLGGLVGAGGFVVWYQGAGSIGAILGPLSAGAVIGIVIGAVLRKLKWLSIMFPHP